MYLSRLFNRGWAKPDRVSVNLTLRCNLTCTMCTTCYEAPELSLTEVKSIIDQTANWGVEVFNPLGGEPFMRADIEEILAYAVRRGFYVTVTTNGTLITRKRAAAIAKIPVDRLHFNFSLDGNVESNDLIRGEGMWKRAIEGYQRLREADAKAGNARRKILTNTILHAQNLAHFEQVLDEQAALGFDGVQILNLFRSDKTKAKPGSEELWFQEADFSSLEQLCERLITRVHEQHPAAYRIQNNAVEIRNIPNYYRDVLLPLEAPCWAGWKELYINADGQAIMCDGKLDFLAGSFGSIRQQSLVQLWNSEQLKERRAVVKACQTPCIQKCYLRQQSDSGRKLTQQLTGLAWGRLRNQVQRLRPHWHKQPGTLLRLELSDVCHASVESQLRWDELTRNCPEPPAAGSWPKYRDEGLLDFGRGFMGFELVRQLMEDLQSRKLHFETLAIRWRGEPLLHPEIEPILGYVLGMVRRGLFERVRIETSGVYLTESVAQLAAHTVPQDWVFDLDLGNGAGIEQVLHYRSAMTRVIVKKNATQQLATKELVRRFSNFSPVVGAYPASSKGDVLWFSRTDHDNFQANAEADKELQNVANLLNLTPPEETLKLRNCSAPERNLVISWDGKACLCTRDTQLQNIVGDINHQVLPEVWAGLKSIRKECSSMGRPQRGFCRSCGFLWSPNAP